MKQTVLSNLTYGMFAIGVMDSGKPSNKPSACIVNTVMQISSSQKPLLTVSMNRSNYSYKCIEKNGIFTVSVLSEETPGTVIGALGLTSGENTDKLKNIRHKVLNEGVPVIKENTCCWMLCKVVDKVVTGTQVLYVAEITAGSDESKGIPMTYNYYKEQLNGRTPQNSPVYIPEDLIASKISGEVHVCSVCGYVYSDRGESFEELPEDWHCPVCKMPKHVFVRR